LFSFLAMFVVLAVLAGAPIIHPVNSLNQTAQVAPPG
jgi:hypothetical protein